MVEEEKVVVVGREEEKGGGEELKQGFTRRNKRFRALKEGRKCEEGFKVLKEE